MNPPRIVADDDTGIDPTDQITKNTMPHFSGFSEVGAATIIATNVTLVIDGSYGDTVASNSETGEYQLQQVSPAMVDGTRMVWVNVSDAAGNVNISSNTTVIIGTWRLGGWEAGRLG